MHWSDVFAHDYTLYPLLAGIALAVSCGLLSVLVVQKRLAFIGEGVAHAGFGGVGLASFLQLTGLARNAVIMGFCVAVGILIGLLSRRRRVMSDTAIGIMLVASMGVGFMLDQLRATLINSQVFDQPPAWYSALTGGRIVTPPPWEQVIFGSILLVGPGDMWIAVGSSLAVILILGSLFKEVTFYAFDETVSHVFGVRSGALHYLVLVLIAVMIVLATKLAGLLLVTALLVAPGATAMLLSRRLSSVLWLSAMLAVGAVLVGYLTSFWILGGRLATGPFIVMCLVIEFVGALAWSRLRSAG